jgi:cell division protein FtsB
MHFKRTGLITKIVIIGLMIYMTISLLDLRTQIDMIQGQKDDLTSQVAAQTLTNQQLSDAIANSDDPDMLESVARSKGYVKPGETLYIDVAN